MSLPAPMLLISFGPLARRVARCVHDSLISNGNAPLQIVHALFESAGEGEEFRWYHCDPFRAPWPGLPAQWDFEATAPVAPRLLLSAKPDSDELDRAARELLDVVSDLNNRNRHRDAERMQFPFSDARGELVFVVDESDSKIFARLSRELGRRCVPAGFLIRAVRLCRWPSPGPGFDLMTPYRELRKLSGGDPVAHQILFVGNRDQNRTSLEPAEQVELAGKLIQDLMDTRFRDSFRFLDDWQWVNRGQDPAQFAGSFSQVTFSFDARDVIRGLVAIELRRAFAEGPVESPEAHSDEPSPRGEEEAPLEQLLLRLKECHPDSKAGSRQRHPANWVKFSVDDVNCLLDDCEKGVWEPAKTRLEDGSGGLQAAESLLVRTADELSSCVDRCVVWFMAADRANKQADVDREVPVKAVDPPPPTIRYDPPHRKPWFIASAVAFLLGTGVLLFPTVPVEFGYVGGGLALIFIVVAALLPKKERPVPPPQPPRRSVELPFDLEFIRSAERAVRVRRARFTQAVGRIRGLRERIEAIRELEAVPHRAKARLFGLREQDFPVLQERLSKARRQQLQSLATELPARFLQDLSEARAPVDVLQSFEASVLDAYGFLFDWSAQEYLLQVRGIPVEQIESEWAQGLAAAWEVGDELVLEGPMSFELKERSTGSDFDTTTPPASRPTILRVYKFCLGVRLGLSTADRNVVESGAES